ncbi:MAG: hypothetical protein JXA67_03435 [Micromonosporaceae bacterium]|nr:hypothetical protein [Micromonosporaceae bacterium]
MPFSQLLMVRQAAAAEVFSGIGQDGHPVTIVVLTPAGAADPAVRAAFCDLAGSNSYSIVSGQIPVHAADLATARPWVANHQYPGQPGAESWVEVLPAPATTPADGFPAAPASGFPAPAPAAAAPWTAPPAAAPWAAAPPVATPWAAAPPVATPWAAPPAPSNRNSLLATIVALSCIAVILIAGVITVVVMSSEQDEHPPTAKSPAPSVAGSPSPEVSTPGTDPSAPTASSTPDTPDAGEPSLRDVTPRSVVGPTYASGDPTYTMAFKGWPFAFRTAASWGCLGGKIDSLPDAKAWVCVDEQNSSAQQKMNIMIRQCATTCTTTERTSMNKQWFDAPDRAKQVFDDRTWIVETAKNDQGYYTVDLSHFFADSSGTMKWQVGLFVQSPPETKAVVQKLMNDVVTQAG